MITEHLEVEETVRREINLKNTRNKSKCNKNPSN